MINPAIENDLKNMSLNDVNYADYIKENYIYIPNNATNGEIIKAVFPKYHYNEIFADVVEMDADLGDNTGFTTDFGKEWWNSPYKADKEGD